MSTLYCQYLICYEEYVEFNQFEGEWEKNWITYRNFDLAEEFKRRISNNPNYRNVSPIFTRNFEE